ncbi:MAG: hypothetical protein AAGJ29_07830, partial [Pseudomonadota bacterium]
LLTFDDFQWADHESRILTTLLVDGSAPRTAQIIVSTRPDQAVIEAANTRGIDVIDLTPLSDDAASKMLDLAELPDLDRQNRQRIIDLSEGNPLFLKSLVGFVSQNDHQRTSTLPPTIEATFQSTLNRLGQERHLALKASIIGREFSLNDLRYITGDNQVDLTQVSSLRESGIFEEMSGNWQFTHILLQEAAYNMMPLADRQSLHKIFADNLIKNDPRRAEDYPEIAADHYIASKDTSRMGASCLSAGISYLKRSVYDRAQYYLEHAVDAIGAETPDDKSPLLTAYMCLAAARVQRLGFTHEDTVASYRSLEKAVADESGHQTERIQALYNVFAHRVMSGNLRAGQRVLSNMRDMADPADSHQSILCLTNETAFYLYSGRSEKSLAASDRLKAIYDTDLHGQMFLSTGNDPLVGALTADANVYTFRGDDEAALRAFELALEHIKTVGATLQEPWAYIFTASAMVSGETDFDAAEERLRLGLEIADKQGSAFWSLNGRTWLSVLASHRGQPADGDLSLATLIKHNDAAGIGLNRPYYQSVYAMDLHRAGQSLEALRQLDAACRMSARLGQRQKVSEIWRKRANVLRDIGKASHAEYCLRIAYAYAERSGATILSARLRNELDSVGESVGRGILAPPSPGRPPALGRTNKQT